MCVALRAYGDEFDVDAFLVGCGLPVCAVKRKGEPVAPASKPNGRRHERSGVHISVADTEFDDFPLQVASATEFLRRNESQMRRLSGFAGVEDINLDFGISGRPALLQCYQLNSEFVRLAGTLGLAIELSVYGTDSESDPG